MSDFIENDANCSVYRSNDPINNLKIRVKLERLSSNALLPSLQRLKIQEDLSRLLNLDDGKDDKKKASKTEVAQALDQSKKSEYEEVVVGWQQKIFNRYEFEFYGKGVGPESSALDQKYFDEIQRIKKRGKQPGRIFTYIENDPNCKAKNLEYFVTDSPNEDPSQLALGVDTVRKRRAVQSRVKLSDEEYLPKTNLVNRKPTPEDLRTNHYASLPHQTMYIMADLSERIDNAIAQVVLVPKPTDEHVLCVIRYYTNGTIVIDPDLNAGKLAYIIETGNRNNEVYHYYLEHASAPMQREDLAKESKILAEVRLRKEAHRAQLIGEEFELSLPRIEMVHVFGEIVSGKNFEYDDLYVYYCLDLPHRWFADPATMFSGYTPTASATQSNNKDDIVYYSHPFDFQFWYDPPGGADDDVLRQVPKIYFQVASLDGWGRYRTEGYTYIDVPNRSGCYDEELSCWRPRGDSIFNELRRFYIGGSNELEHISDVAIPKQFPTGKTDKPFSRFGFRTVTTGSLNIRFNVVCQSEEIQSENRKRMNARNKQRYGFNSYMNHVDATVDAYEQAKKRAQEVRESSMKILSPETTHFE